MRIYIVEINGIAQDKYYFDLVNARIAVAYICGTRKVWEYRIVELEQTRVIAEEKKED